MAGAHAGKTVVEFDTPGDFDEVFSAWLREEGFRLRETGTSRELYQKGGVLAAFVAAIVVEVERESPKVSLGAWVRSSTAVRLASLFMVPPEMSIESGGQLLFVPRRVARTSLNRLLSRLRQRLVE